MQKRERYAGALVGVLAGDALGAPYETWPAKKIQADFTIRGGLVLFDYDDPWGKDGRFPAGRPTDDSELTAALGMSLCFANGEPNDLYQRFRSIVVDGRSVLCDLPAYGFGRTTREALAAETYDEARKRILARPPVPSNGSLMRTAPVALRYHGNFGALVDTARRASVITHTHPQAVECSVVYSLILDRMLDGDNVQLAVTGVRKRMKQLLTDKELTQYICRHAFEKPDEPNKRNRGGALLTLRAALWAAAEAKDFRDGITKAVGFGGDTDTYGAVAGGLLGAAYGLGGIPHEWTAKMSGQGLEVMVAIASNLWHLNNPT